MKKHCKELLFERYCRREIFVKDLKYLGKFKIISRCFEDILLYVIVLSDLVRKKCVLVSK